MHARTFPATRRPLLLAALVSAALAAGCATTSNMGERERGTATGAAIGALGGAAIGANSANAGKGAVIGAAVGAVAGNLWSKHMEDKRREMEKATAGTGIDVSRTADNRLKVNIPSDFSFDTGSARIKPAMEPVLSQFARGLDSRSSVEVVGYTDSTGSDAVNNPLSLDRAQSVRGYLVNQGVPATRIATEGRGSSNPIASNSTSAGRAENRRVEIYLYEPQG